MPTIAHQRFERLYDANYRAVVGYFLRRLDHAAPAQDLAEEVFLVAWRKLDEVPEGDEARYWLFGVARRMLANHHRKITRRWRIGSQYRPIPESLEPIEDQVVRQDEVESVLLALGRLTARDQELIRLAYWEELPHSAIAELVGCSQSTVDVRIHRAIRRLAKALDRTAQPMAQGGSNRNAEDKP